MSNTEVLLYTIIKCCIFLLQHENLTASLALDQKAIEVFHSLALTDPRPAPFLTLDGAALIYQMLERAANADYAALAGFEPQSAALYGTITTQTHGAGI